MVDRVAREAGLDTSQPISLIRLQESLQQMRDRRLGGPGTTPGELPASRGNTARTDSTKPTAPTIPGFGAEFETIVVPGFGETLAVTSTGTLASTSSTPATPTVNESERRSRGESSRDRDDEERGGRGRGRGGDRGFDRRGEGERGDDNNRRSEPVAAAVSSTSTTTPSTASPSRGGNENDRIRRIAQAMLSRYDENKDGTLQREEWSKMSNEPEKGDKNGDGQITLDEMAERLGEWRPTGSSSSAASGSSSSVTSGSVTSGSGASGGSSATSTTGTGNSFGRGDFGGRGRGRGGFGRDQSRPTTTASGQAHRFLTPKERLPADLPSFFSGDRDGDGQVSMAEFTSSWDDAKLAEFNRWDLNRDGMITPAETLRASSR
jgi:Ca2+-binding EF-hand superfamily protein